MVTTVELDRNGDGVVDQTTTTTTLIEADGTKSVKEVRRNGTATVGTKTLRTSANGLTAEVTEDVDGNGTIDQRQQSVRALGADGSVVEETTRRSANNALISRTTKTTSANGMSVVTVIDENGDATADRRVEETLSAAGVMTSVETELGAANAVLSRSTTTVQRGGLDVTQAFDRNGDGTTDQSRTTSTTIAANGTRTTVSSEFQGTSTLTERATTTESANGLSKSVVFVDGSLNTRRMVKDTLEMWTPGARRSISLEDMFRFASHGGIGSIRTITDGDGSTEIRTQVITSINEQMTLTTRDIDGDGVTDETSRKRLEYGALYASSSGMGKESSLYETVDGLVRDRTFIRLFDDTPLKWRESAKTALNADGSRTATSELSTENGGNWVVRGKEEVTTSGSGLQTVSKWNDTGNTGWALQETETKTLNADGSVTSTELWQRGTQTVRRTEEVT
ncbi:hypothetical protein, partial [Microcoleus anatoxicus]|uniref:hypothetical protein n=1 Tax=Microcoleus anatoxicus TaxID=2705319 RepID=UPI0030C8F5EA